MPTLARDFTVEWLYTVISAKHNYTTSVSRSVCGGSNLQMSAKVLKVALRHVEDEHGQQRHSKDDTTALGSYDELKTAVG